MKFVAVTCDRRAAGPLSTSSRVRPPRQEVFVKSAVVEALRAAGLTPLLVPPAPIDPIGFVAALLDRVHGVVITGGSFDIHPRHYGGVTPGRLDHIDEGRTVLEMELARACIARDVPALGLCGGEQVLAVVTGGTLVGDLALDHPGAQEHEQPTDPATGWHPVHVQPSRLRDALGRADVVVNSTHHQAVSDPGQLRVTAWSPDGVVEAVEMDDHRFCMGVQWHPELLAADPHHGIFRALAAAMA
jgi:putative glutamine amidotransferase